MTVIDKYPNESIFRYHQFRRPDGRGWLNESETLAGTPTVTSTDQSTGEAQPSMISNVAIYNQTQVLYRLTGGTAGKTYMITITVTSSNGQIFEDRLLLTVRK